MIKFKKTIENSNILKEINNSLNDLEVTMKKEEELNKKIILLSIQEKEKQEIIGKATQTLNLMRNKKEKLKNEIKALEEKKQEINIDDFIF